MRIGKTWAVALLLSWALLAAAPAALAAQAPLILPDDTDLTYSGLLDPQTGAPPAQSGQLEQEQKNTDTVKLSETMSYLKADRLFIHYFPSDRSQFFYANVPENMVANQAVTINVPEGMNWKLYRNGDLMQVSTLSELSQTGAYVLEVFSTNNVDSTALHFQILSGPTNAYPVYTAPEGFVITSVTLDNVDFGSNLGRKMTLDNDGVYVFQIKCEEAGLSYSVRIDSDRTPPALALEGVVDGESPHEVSLEDVESGAALEATLDGDPLDLKFGKVLTQVGRYSVKITDAAGNSAEYSFRIKLYFTVSSMTAILLLVGAVAAVFGYSRYVRNHVRVR